MSLSENAFKQKAMAHSKKMSLSKKFLRRVKKNFCENAFKQASYGAE